MVKVFICTGRSIYKDLMHIATVYWEIFEVQLKFSRFGHLEVFHFEDGHLSCTGNGHVHVF